MKRSILTKDGKKIIGNKKDFYDHGDHIIKRSYRRIDRVYKINIEEDFDCDQINNFGNEYRKNNFIDTFLLIILGSLIIWFMISGH